MENLHQDYMTGERWLERYGDYILNHGERPKNVYLFAKEHGSEEKEFYHYYAGFGAMEKEILNHLFRKSLELASQVPAFTAASAKEKLLNVYFIFFENLTMNRSLVLFLLGRESIRHVKILDHLKETHQQFVDTLNFSEWELFEKAGEDFRRFSEKSRRQALWLHLLSCIDFWKKDASPDFEKTDIYIEKTVDTGFELIDNEPLRKLVDLGKFLWKEKR